MQALVVDHNWMQALVVDHNWMQALVVDHNWMQALVVDHNWMQALVVDHSRVKALVVDHSRVKALVVDHSRVLVGVTLARPLDSIEGTGLSPCNPWSRHGKWIVHTDYRRIRRAGSDDRSIGLALELLLDCPDCLELRHVLKERGAWMVPLVVGRHLSLRRRN
jgi:hypothetical protein